MTAMVWDALVMSLVIWYISKPEVFVYLAPACVGTWVLSNVLNLPSSNRRYVSFIHAYYDILIPFSFFSVLYYIFLTVFFPDWTFSIALFWFYFKLFAFILIDRFILVFALRIYRSLGRGTSNYLLVGSHESTDYMRNLFDHRPENGYVFVDSFDWDSEKLNTWIEKLKQEKSLVDEVYLFPNSIFLDRTTTLITEMDKLGINVYLIPFDSTRHIGFYNFRRINRKSIEEIERGPLRKRRNRAMKRGFDLFLAGAISVLILSWLIPILAILIKLDSKGPVFYIQKRAGIGGKYYRCFKLRTMYTDHEEHDRQATRFDPRVTKIGRLLRMSNLDEIPQFFNVLIGNMSIIGPRPHIMSLNEKYQDKIENYADRMLVKPGITGLSQVYGYRGETPQVEDMKIRIETDLVYLKNWTFLLDLRIVLKTVRTSLLVSDSNAY